MFDIETLSTFPHAAVIAIAVVIRDDQKPQHKQARSWFIDQAHARGDRNPETIAWWEQQDSRVKDIVFGGNQTPREALHELNSFLNSNLISEDQVDDVRCYAAPAMFDFPILRNQYYLQGITPAWSWRSERCLSTMIKEIQDNFNIEIRAKPPELKHHPIHDCLEQFEELDLCLAELKIRSRPTGY